MGGSINKVVKCTGVAATFRLRYSQRLDSVKKEKK